jgi:hypothetical protein
MSIVRPIQNEEEFRAWVASRPQVVQEMIARCPPDRLYRMRDSGHRAIIYSYGEDGTVTVEVTGEFNRVVFGRRVFGVSLGNLEECDLPPEGEDLGDTAAEAGYSEADIRRILLPKLRQKIN